MNTPSKRIIICADDFGLNDAVCDGITALLSAGRISATSVMVNQPLFKKRASDLKPFMETADVGLHFDLTEGPSLTKGLNTYPLAKLLALAHMRMLPKALLKSEWHAQLDQFEATMKAMPDHIDGHQHVHQFPVIQEVLMEVLNTRYGQSSSKPYVRSLSQVVGLQGFSLKPFVLAKSGAKSLQCKLRLASFPYNRSFSGIYDFDPNQPYHPVITQALQHSVDGGLIMCHPATSIDPNDNDPIAHARVHEYHYLMSDEWSQLLYQQARLVSGRECLKD